MESVVGFVIMMGCKIPEKIPIGETLWDKKHTREQLDIVKTGDIYTYTSQYQQRPAPIGGGMFKDEYWSYYKILPSDIVEIKIFADTAMKTAEHNDYSVFQCWAHSMSKGIFLIDQMRGKWEAPELESNMLIFWNKHKPTLKKPLGVSEIMVEDKSSGTGLIQSIAKNTMIPISGIQRDRDKVTRAFAVVKYFSMGYIHLPEDADFLPDYKDEFRKFTPAMTHRHDDQIDPTMDAVENMLAFSDSMYNDNNL